MEEILIDADYVSIFSIGYHYLLNPDEGVVVKYKEKLYIIWKCLRDSTVKIQPLEREDIIKGFEFDKIKEGMLIWMHDNEVVIN